MYFETYLFPKTEIGNFWKNTKQTKCTLVGHSPKS